MSLEISVFHKRNSLLMQNTWRMTFLGKKIVVFFQELVYIFQNQATGSLWFEEQNIILGIMSQTNLSLNSTSIIFWL